MERWLGRVCLVTGASEGIGKAVVEVLVRHGLTVVGVARNIDKLKQIGHDLAAQKLAGNYLPLKCDLREEADIKALFAEIKSKFDRIDILINNAGLARDASLITGTTEAWREMCEVNILGLSICTREAVQLMLDKNINDGQIVNISSMSGHRIVPSASTHFYSATKFAVRALTEGLRQELREKKVGIRVASISPGMVETQFSYRLNENDPNKAKAAYSSIPCIQAADVAKVVVDVLTQPSYVEINDVLMRPTAQIS